MKKFKKVIAGAVIGVMTFSSMSFAAFDVDKITTLKDLFKGLYYEEVDDDTMMKGAIQGMLSSLDRYSVYYSKDEAENFRNTLDGKLVGIGIIMAKENDELVIKQVIDKSPADKIGLVEGVKILKVDGVDVKELELEKVAQMIKGEIDTKVTLTVDFYGKVGDVSTYRDEFNTPSVDFQIYEDEKVGYISIDTFDRDTSKEVQEKLRLIDFVGAKNLVIDLRGNTGGYLVEGVNVAKLFVPEGKICTMKDKNGEEKVYESTLKEPKYNIVVLTNEYTASAAEILTAAIKESGAGMVVGKKTFGKGCVQQIVSLGDMGIAKITVTNIYTPNGNEINGVGVTPDVEVSGANEQLAKAIEMFKN